MHFSVKKTYLALILVIFCVIQCKIAASYKTEIEITPSPIEEPTTKKSGFFGGIKNFFRGSPTTTVAPLILEVTTPKNFPPQQPSPVSNVAPHTPPAAGPPKPPPLVIPHAPLMPLGPRPDTPPSSPLAGNQQQPPQWPQPATATSSTPTHFQQQLPSQQLPQSPQYGATTFGSGGRLPANAGAPGLPPGFTPYRPNKPQPSGLDLSYGGATAGGRPQSGGRPGFGLAPMGSPTTSTTTTTTTTPRPDVMNFDLRGGLGVSTTTTHRPLQTKDEYPALPPPRRPSIKEDFPGLPPPKSPSPTPSSPQRPSSPSAWNTPLSTPESPVRPSPPKPQVPGPLIPAVLPATQPTPPSPIGGSGNRVSFVPHTGSTTTVRPGFQGSGNTLATDDEILTLTESLYAKEVNSQLSMIRVNPQGKTRSIDSGDEAPQPLLEVEAKALESPTVAKMQPLFNNYDSDTMTNEHVTPNERKEENDFLDAIMATSVMRHAMLFLQNKGLVTPDPKTHRDLVKELWFTQYSRGSGRIGSSGFEHVFVHEVKNGTIIGLHNWVYYHEEEKAGRLDYKGFIRQLDLGTKGKVMKVRFTHNGLNKPVNTLFIGTSPELEMALYTVCFQLRPDRTCPVSLGDSKLGIVTYSWRYRGKSLIGSAYPEI